MIESVLELNKAYCKKFVLGKLIFVSAGQFAAILVTEGYDITVREKVEYHQNSG